MIPMNFNKLICMSETSSKAGVNPDVIELAEEIWATMSEKWRKTFATVPFHDGYGKFVEGIPFKVEEKDLYKFKALMRRIYVEEKFEVSFDRYPRFVPILENLVKPEGNNFKKYLEFVEHHIPQGLKEIVDIKFAIDEESKYAMIHFSKI